MLAVLLLWLYHAGISLGGFVYGNGGVKEGAPSVERLLRDVTGDGNIRLTLSMPPGSAAIVQLPKE